METQVIDIDILKKRAIKGALSLTFRRVITYIITAVIINVVLPKYLDPALIGTFNLANTIISFFGFFSDFGLAASIIQKKDISQEDVTTTFIIQELLVGALVLIIITAAPVLAGLYQLDLGGVTLIRALAISFFLVSLKSIPSVLLERNLNFKPIAIVEIIENVVYAFTILPLALSGFGLYSYAIARLAATVIGVVILYNLSPWRMKFGFSAQAARGLLRFGIPFQLNSILALVKDRLIVLVIARLLTLKEIGYVSQAQAWAFIPLEAMNIIIRVTFPAYARLQHDRETLARAVERSLYIMGVFLYPAIAGIVVLLPLFIEVVGRNKWGAAIPLIYLYSFTVFWASVSTTFTNVFNAIGEIKLTLKLMVMWTALEWIITPILVIQFGYLGVGLSSAIISFSSIVTIIMMRRILQVKLFDSIGVPVLCAATMGVVLYGLSRYLLTSKLALLPLIAIGGLIYFSLIIMVDRRRFLAEVKEIFRAVR